MNKKTKYQHYKNGEFYEIIDFALHSETLEEMVVYNRYGDRQIWVRPKIMFFENVEHNGVTVPRFKLVNSED
jgi:hypothetical protein